ncbi:MAG TPA: nuclear transport factor 2 family protein [Dehalococcoidia bacterium]|nr:nuclear transport factor 2 family protein [Dehalococcoidia bacterium]
MATKDIIEAYLAAWNETDEAKIRSLLEKCWAEGGTYTDPVSDVAGRDGLFGAIQGFHAQLPGAAIALTSGIDEHHGRVRFGWKVTGSPQEIAGIDIGVMAADGRLQSILGFWGANPPAA